MTKIVRAIFDTLLAGRLREVLVFGAILASFVLGLIGFLAAAARLHPQPDHAFLFAVLTSLQLFVLNVGAGTVAEGGTSAWVASYTAPASTVMLVVFAFVPVISRRWRLLILRLRGADDVFIGAGDQARAIVAQLVQQRSADEVPLNVVVLDTASSNATLSWLGRVNKRARTLAFVGDGRDRLMLLAAGVGHARTRVWILTGSDACNVEILRQVNEVRSKHPMSRSSVTPQAQIIVGVREDQLLRSTLDLWPDLARLPHVEWVSLPRLAAMQLLKRHPPHFPLRHEKRVLHLAVVGSSEWTEPLLVYLSHHCVYALEPERALRITLIAPDASAQLRALYTRHPLLDPANQVEPLCRDLLPLARLRACDAAPSTLLPSRWTALQKAPLGGHFDTVYVAERHDEASFAALRRLAALRDIEAAQGAVVHPQLVVYTNDRQAKDPSNNGAWPSFVKTFDAYAACFGGMKCHPFEVIDEGAQMAHAFFDAPPWRLLNPGADDRAMAERVWKDDLLSGKLIKAFLWSSRYASSHADVKVSLQAEAFVGAQEAEAWLADLENRRFAVERLVWNWLPLTGPRSALPGPSELTYEAQKDAQGIYRPSQKTLLDLNRTLIPRVLLPEGERDKDEVISRVTQARVRRADDGR